MGIFNAAIEIGKLDSVSKVKFNVDLSGYATKKQFKAVKREMEEYLHRNKVTDNKMTRPLDMGGSGIINLGNPEKPYDAAPRRFVFRKIQSLINDYSLDILKAPEVVASVRGLPKTIKDRSAEIAQLKTKITTAEENLIKMQKNIVKGIKDFKKVIGLLLDKSTSEEDIKKALGDNTTWIVQQTEKIKERFVEHQELKKELDAAEKKLQAAYQVEIQAKVTEFNNSLTKVKNDLATKIEEYKSNIEKAATERGDGIAESYNTQLANHRTAFQQSIATVNDRYTELSNVITALKEIEIAELDSKVSAMGNKLNLAIEDIIENKDSLETTKESLKTTKESLESIKNELNNDKVIQSKRIDDLGNTILDLVQDNKKLKRKLSKLNNAIYETTLIEYYNKLEHEVKVISASRGVATQYELKDPVQQKVKTPDFFELFGLLASPAVDYKDYIKLNHNFNVTGYGSVQGFMVKRPGKYIISVKLIIKIISGDVEKFAVRWHEGKIVDDKGNNSVTFNRAVEIIEREIKDNKFIFEKDLEIERLNLNDGVVFYPEVIDDNLKFTMVEGSYVRLTHFWDGFTVFDKRF